ncbi:MAG: SCP2 sterol-binding domain-containing protein [Chloroflexota bacterium]|nr:MAG: SCP2 sterol-binding domain-containing protein [Chloroflexota bacterium]UCF29028.1 MAG: SCP2 sterol-binding domain-containing protein [Chloroflexota bacterium]
MAIFLTEKWLQDFEEKLNSDPQYAEIARDWEGDVVMTVNSGKNSDKPVVIYFDLWHGKCRQAYFVENNYNKEAAFILKGDYENYARILKGELHPMQAMLTRKLSVQGNMGLMMRSVPTVLDFVRCAQEVTEIPD